MRVEFYKHHLGEAEKQAICDTLDGIFLTTGPRTKAFEERFAETLGVKHCVGVTSCTMAAFLTLKACDIGPGDEVITSPMTFIATPNVILHAGATPVFVDVLPETGNIDPSAIEAAITPRTKAIMPVHLYGHLADMNAIRAVADKHGLLVIEDSAHCIEGERDGYRTGQRGHAACFSFYATKIIACGEGGAIATNDTALYERLLKYRLHGMSKGAADRYSKRYQHWDMELLGYKANMSDIQAALLLPQMDRLDERWQRRETICRAYEAAFAPLDDVRFPIVLPGVKSSRHLFTIWVKHARRDDVLADLQERGVGVAVNFRAVHLLTYYRETFGYTRGTFPVAEKIGDETISLPLYSRLADDQIRHVTKMVSECAALNVRGRRE